MLNFIKENFIYAYILHDKDILDDGTFKKPHWHIIIRFPNPRSLDALKKLLNHNYIETCNFYFYSRYLLHLDNPDKHLYSVSDISSNMINNIVACLGKEINSFNIEHRLLFSYISCNPKISFLTLSSFAVENDCVSELKKNAFYYKCLLGGK